jgi:hypothetical protein
VNLIKKIASIATGGIGQLAFDVAKTYFPPSMSDGEKEQARLSFQNMELQRQREADAATMEAEQQLTQRVKELEGSAADLLKFPILGHLVLFLRGCQRPVWGFATLYLDWRWFSSWTLSEQQETALIVINFLVLGFLFGERAVKNVMPLIVRMFEAKGDK